MAFTRLPLIRLRAQRGGGGPPEGRWRGHSASQQILRRTDNRISHFVNSVFEINDGNTHDSNPLRFEPRVALQITFRTVAHIMGDAVELDRQAGLRTIKIKHVPPNRMLATKSRLAGRTFVQLAPEQNFRRR